MPHPTVVIDVVGLTSGLLGEASPRITALAGRGRVQRLTPVLNANHFWFAWAVFKPKTVIRSEAGMPAPSRD